MQIRTRALDISLWLGLVVIAIALIVGALLGIPLFAQVGSGNVGVPGGPVVSPGFWPQRIFAGPWTTYFDDFFTGANVSINSIGTGGTCAVTSGGASADINHPGVLLLTTGTTTGNGETCGTQAQNATVASLNLVPGWTWETAVNIASLPGTTNASYQAGFTTSPNANPWTGGIQFYLSSANGVANDWYCRYNSTQVDSGVAAVAATWTRLTIYSDGVTAHWYINGVEAVGCATPIANLPSAKQYTASWSATALGAITATTMAVDYVDFQRALTR